MKAKIIGANFDETNEGHRRMKETFTRAIEILEPMLKELGEADPGAKSAKFADMMMSLQTSVSIFATLFMNVKPEEFARQIARFTERTMKDLQVRLVEKSAELEAIMNDPDAFKVMASVNTAANKKEGNDAGTESQASGKLESFWE